MELANVYKDLIQHCIDVCIPDLWKLSEIKPVPKKSTPKDYNDYRLIVLTCGPFKCLE